MKYFPQHDYLVSPKYLYGLPCVYLVLAISGNFAMRSRSALDVGIIMKL